MRVANENSPGIKGQTINKTFALRNGLTDFQYRQLQKYARVLARRTAFQRTLRSLNKEQLKAFSTASALGEFEVFAILSFFAGSVGLIKNMPLLFLTLSAPSAVGLFIIAVYRKKHEEPVLAAVNKLARHLTPDIFDRLKFQRLKLMNRDWTRN